MSSSNARTFSESTQAALYSLMPSNFFESKRVAKAPEKAVNAALFFYYSAAFASFGALFAYYYNLSTPVTSISLTLLAGQTCTVLSPKRGVTYYSTETSENGQFAAPFLSKDECIGNLTKTYKVCDAANRFDHVSVLGVSNPNNSQFYASGYFAFTPSTATGLTSQISTVYAPSVAFPRPDVSKSFQGVSSNWYVHSIKNNSYVDYKKTDISSTVFNAHADGSVFVYLKQSKTSLDLTSNGIISSPTPDSVFADVFTNTANVIQVSNDVAYGINSITTQLVGPYSVAVDGSGSMYVTDRSSAIRKISTSTGVVTTLGADASFKNPTGVAVDRLGNIYVADTGSNLVRKINIFTNVVSRLGPNASPAFNTPLGVAVDILGNVFVADTGNNLVRKIDAVTQVVSSLGPNINTVFSQPSGVAVDGSGNVYVADEGYNLVRKIDAVTGVMTSIGIGASPAFSGPMAVAVDGSGNVYVADIGNNLIRKIDAVTQTVSSLGQTASPGFSQPQGLAIDKLGIVYVADSGNNQIRKIDTMAKDASSLGPGPRPVFKNLTGIAIDGAGNVYSTDLNSGDHLVNKIDSLTGAITKIGGVTFHFAVDVAVDGSGNVYVADEGYNLVRKIDAVTGVMTSIGIGASPAFSGPMAVAVDGSGNVYVADIGNNLIRKIDAVTGAVSSLGLSASPVFSNPYGVAVDGFGNVYVADYGNRLVRKIDAVTQVVTTLGPNASPAFKYPSGVAVDGSGNVYVADTGNNLVRKIDAVTQVVSSLGLTLYPPLNQPSGVAVDGSGNVYVADSGNNLVRKIKNIGNFGLQFSPSVTINSFVRGTNIGNLAAIYSTSIIPPHSNLMIMYSDATGFPCKSCVFFVYPPPNVTTICTNDIVFSQYDSHLNASFVGLADTTVASFGTALITRAPLYIALMYDTQNSIPVQFADHSLTGPLPYVYFDIHKTIETIIVGIFDTPRGILLFTSYVGQPVTILRGSTSDAGIVADLKAFNTHGNSSFPHLSKYYKNFISLIQSSSSVSASVILTAGEPRRYVLLNLVSAVDGSSSTVTYDTYTDAYYTFEVPVKAAPTSYMLAYTYGICSGNLTKYLVELSGTLDYSITCPKQNGLYYQSPNIYHPLPSECLHIPHDRLLNDCAAVAHNMNVLVNLTCHASIEKVCTTQYTDNPPYNCIGYTYSPILTVLSLSFSTTAAIIGFVTILLSCVLSLTHSETKATLKEFSMVNLPYDNKTAKIVSAGDMQISELYAPSIDENIDVRSSMMMTSLRDSTFQKSKSKPSV